MGWSVQEASPDAARPLVVLTPVVAGGAARTLGPAAQQQGQAAAAWGGATLILDLATPAATPLLPVGRLSFGQVQSCCRARRAVLFSVLHISGLCPFHSELWVTIY